MTKCDKIRSAMDIALTKKENITSTTSINCHNIYKKDIILSCIKLKNNELQKVCI